MSRSFSPTRVARILALLLVTLGAAWFAGRVAERRALAALADSARADATLRRALLASEIARYELMPLALADDRDVVASLRGTPGAVEALNRKLGALAANTGAAVIYVLDPAGCAIAASNWASPSSFIGQDYGFRTYYRDARRRGAGREFALGTVSRRPGLFLSRRARDGGMVVVKLDFSRIEEEWRRAGGITFVEDARGVVLVTSRPDWRFARTRATPAELRPIPLSGTPPRVRIAGPRPTDALLVALAPDAQGWRLRLVVPLGGGVEAARRAAEAVALLGMLAMLGGGWALRERRRRRRDQEAAAAVRTSELEAMVERRTAELRHEMAEREAGELRAAELRERLRQANRLAALGQITAGIAHETAQPIAAIRSYAASGEVLLAQHRFDELGGNLAAIGRLTERIGTITAELRGFSRKGTGQIAPMPLAEAIDGTRLMLKERLARVRCQMPALAPDLRVMADKVRLEQVLINLLQNALDAIERVNDPEIAITLADARDTPPGMVLLRVADNGPGIAPDIAARLFTPFVTSRAAGLGLGLVIAQDIMVDMGGSLRLLPSPRGALFEIELRRAEVQP